MKSRELSGLQFGRLFEEKVTSHLPISSVFKKGLNEVSESPLSVPSSASDISVMSSISPEHKFEAQALTYFLSFNFKTNNLPPPKAPQHPLQTCKSITAFPHRKSKSFLQL
jgi:hypothetical protein